MHDTLPRSSYSEEPSIRTAMELENSEPSLKEYLRDMPEQLKNRIETAESECEFERSSEIDQAIRGYYVDHYRTAMIVDSIIEEQAIDTDIFTDEETMLESFQITQDLEKILTQKSRASQLGMLHDFIAKSLFSEAAVGQTTITDQEISLVIGLNRKLLDKAGHEGVHIDRPNTDDYLLAKLEAKNNLFWQDSRAAGQLEFHNTPFADELAQDNFKIRTKQNQKEEKGHHQSVTADVKNHSQSIHFSETYLSDSYKDVHFGNRVDKVTIGGTVAVPLAEVVKQLPYARGGEYGVVALKTDAENKATVIDDANIFAFSGRHEHGYDDDAPSAEGGDRTFYADKYDRAKGENYALDFGRAMSSSVGNVSHIIFLQRDIDIAHRQQYMKDAGNVDDRINFGSGEGYPSVEVLDYDYGAPSMLERGEAMKEGSMFIDEQYHAHSANGLGLVDSRLKRVATEHKSYRDGVTPEQQAQELRDAIREMQRRSRELPQYQGKLVVMLRGGTMAFKPTA